MSDIAGERFLARLRFAERCFAPTKALLLIEEDDILPLSRD
ncbi:hypothetical protein [Dysgonomonas sp. 25]|nr:hypothetical protein [Dysgonomonas sp. 25]